MEDKCDIDEVVEILRLLRESPFDITKEEKQIAKVKKEYEELKKKIKAYLVCLLDKKTSRSLKIAKVNQMVDNYKK